MKKAIKTKCGTIFSWTTGEECGLIGGGCALDKLLKDYEKGWLTADERFISEPKEIITHVALKLQDGSVHSLPAPNRHHNLFVIASLKYLPDNTFEIGHAEQGFLTSTGRFVGRKDAGVIAVSSGQIKSLKWPPSLFSEDLW